MERIRNTVLLYVTALMVSVSAYATTEDSTRRQTWYKPSYIPVQFAGNIGVLSTGLGFTSSNANYHLELLYGYVPKSIGQAYIHTVTIKNYLPFGQFPLTPRQSYTPYLGLGVSVEVSRNAFFRMPSHFPDGYYNFPKNVHLLAYGGVRVQHLFAEQKWLRGLEFFAEGGTIDVYLWYKTMTRDIRMTHIFSVAMGVHLMLAR